MADPSVDPYAVLGVDAGCDQRTIDRAYRKLARTLHPDTNPDPAARTRMAAVNEAYSTLSRADRRADYDRRTGIAATGASGSSPAPAAAGADLGRAGIAVTAVRPDSAGRGATVDAVAVLTAAELVTGATRTLQLDTQTACQSCRGTGGDRTGPVGACPACDGLGMSAVDGSRCPTCAGSGAVGQRPCPACGGSRQQPLAYATTLTFGPGETDGTTRRFPRRGLPGGPGQHPGDLNVTIRLRAGDVSPAPEPGRDQAQPAAGSADTSDPEGGPFVYHNNGVGLVVPFYAAELLAGVTVTVPAVGGGQVSCIVPPGTRPGTILAVGGGGLPGPDGDRGVLHVRCDLAPDPSTSDEVRRLAAALAAAQVTLHDPRHGLRP